MAEINTWPGWECVRLLGAGSYGKVYEIKRTEFGKTYSAALKVITIPRDQADIQNAYSDGMSKESVTTYFRSIVERITGEFALMSDLKGFTNIVSYQDHKVIEHENEIGWDILIRMELLTSLQSYCSQNTLSERQIVKLGCDICRALELCWEMKIVHRDIKPENIFVNRHGDYELGDFGVARTIENEMTTASLAGTETYMAPEVYWGRKYGPTADIYSLAIVLYRYLNNNRAPFLPLGDLLAGDRERAKEHRMSGDTIPEPMNGSKQLKQVVLKALNYDPKRRYQSAAEFRRELELCIPDEDEDEDTRWLEPEDEDEDTRQLEPEDEDEDTIQLEPEDDDDEDTKLLEPTDEEIPSSKQNDESEEDKKSSFLKLYQSKRRQIVFGGTAVGIVIILLVIISIVSNPKQSQPLVSSDKLHSESAVSDTEDTNDTSSLDSSNMQDDTRDETESINSDAPVASNNTSDSMEVFCYTNTLLAGDSINTRLKDGDWILDGVSASIKWNVDNPSVASIDDQGVLTANAAGICNLTAEHEGKTATQQITVVEVDQSSGATVTADYEKLSLSENGEDTVNLTFGGAMPENFGAAAYYSAGISLILEWGELNDNKVSLTIKDVLSAQKEGYVTVLVYDQNNPNIIVASIKIQVRINK